MRKIGFSTGAVSFGDFDGALKILAESQLCAVELSALRISEVRPLVEAIPRLDLASYEYISVHAPSSFSRVEEPELVALLMRFPREWPIVVHPDAIYTPDLWRVFGTQMAIENMDRRKPIGRTAAELARVFTLYPEARLCFDIGHARQFDASMSEAYLIITSFWDRIVQVHVSEVDTSNRHDRVSFAAEIAFRQVSKLLPQDAPLILESRISQSAVDFEVQRTLEMFDF